MSTVFIVYNNKHIRQYLLEYNNLSFFYIAVINSLICHPNQILFTRFFLGGGFKAMWSVCYIPFWNTKHGTSSKKKIHCNYRNKDITKRLSFLRRGMIRYEKQPNLFNPSEVNLPS